MNIDYQELVSQFKELMESGESVQWELAEVAFLASEAEHGGLKQFAADTGYAVKTIDRYKKAYSWKMANQITLSERDLSFADVYVLASMSEDRAAAVQVLAGATGKPIGTVKSDTEAINTVRDFLTENPELVKDALKDDDTRSAVASAAFKAATEDVVAEAEGVTKTAAKDKLPTATPGGQNAVQIQRLILEITRAARENGLVTERWGRDFGALVEYMNAEELSFIDEQLGLIMVKTGELRTIVRNHMKASV